MKYNKKILYLLIPFIVIMIIQACSTYYFRSNYQTANKLIHIVENIETKPFLKAHYKNGDVCILQDSWTIDTLRNVVSGSGVLYDFNRNQTYEGNIDIPIDSIAIFETNRKIKDPEKNRIVGLSFLAGIDLMVGMYCYANPKACFGSCPTFYLNEKDNFHYADAEGFTNAISPSMEYYDIDALNNKQTYDSIFSITMKNEALETHCIKNVKLMAFPRKSGERIYQSPTNDFYLCQNNYPISKAKANEGNITHLLINNDREERFSLSDENNLKSKEEIFINFDNIKNTENLGLIINFRQTLLTTYLFYTAMGYMGDNVSDIFAKLETDKEIRENFDKIAKELGNIEIHLWNEQTKKWEFQNEVEEAGPIAINKQILPFKNIKSTPNVKLKIVLNKGHWRIDYLALTNIKEKVKPIEISASSILDNGIIDNSALYSINNPDKYLISMPGSKYKINFILPNKDIDYELFLYSKGYYLEWMRNNWLKDKNLLQLDEMVYKPNKYLKKKAKEFKQYESKMEQIFWNSKINSKTFSYH